MDLGERIASARAEAGVTQQELAEMLFVSRELVSKWELGQRRPDLEMLAGVARALSVPEGALISRGDYVFAGLQRCLPPGEAPSRERLTELINRFLEGLPQKDADVFVGKFYFLNSNPEIADTCCMKENQVRSRLSKTVKKLRKFLKEERENERF